MRGGLLKTVHRRGGGRSLDDLDRVVVFTCTVGTALIALLLEKLLGFRVCEAKEQLYTILAGNIVEFSQNLLCDVAGFESKAENELL